MDLIGLEILRQELAADAKVVAGAVQQARDHVNRDAPGRLEACAYELHRGYNVIERALERLCEAFENHFERRGEYHERLLERMTLDLPGLRPAFLPIGARQLLREWKGFRHVVRHAYDLEIDPARLTRMCGVAAEVAAQFPGWCSRFLSHVEDALDRCE